jgi:predicted AlkP superfamily pyrophosphatase or phosphodiesterase
MKRISVLSLFLLLACSGSGATPRSNHVLVIGIDGVRVDALRQASTPELDELIAGGTVSYDSFAGGVLGTPSEQGTWSGPGWASILTGVWIDKHGVRFNGFVDARFDEYPHFFARIREQRPDAYLSSFVTWGPIHDHILASARADTAFWPEEAKDSAEGDLAVTQAVVAHLTAEDPDVVFVQLDEVDHQGHVAGFSPTVSEYVSALEVVDGQIGQMIDAVRARSTVDDEDWLIVVTTDHGGLGVAHGEQSAEERTIFVIVNGGRAGRGDEISPGPGHTAVPPTALKHLGLPIDPAWGWESEPFGL